MTLSLKPSHHQLQVYLQLQQLLCNLEHFRTLIKPFGSPEHSLHTISFLLHWIITADTHPDGLKASKMRNVCSQAGSSIRLGNATNKDERKKRGRVREESVGDEGKQMAHHWLTFMEEMTSASHPPLTPACLWLAVLLPSNYDKLLSHTQGA